MSKHYYLIILCLLAPIFSFGQFETKNVKTRNDFPNGWMAVGKTGSGADITWTIQNLNSAASGTRINVKSLHNLPKGWVQTAVDTRSARSTFEETTWTVLNANGYNRGAKITVISLDYVDQTMWKNVGYESTSGGIYTLENIGGSDLDVTTRNDTDRTTLKNEQSFNGSAYAAFYIKEPKNIAIYIYTQNPIYLNRKIKEYPTGFTGFIGEVPLWKAPPFNQLYYRNVFKSYFNTTPPTSVYDPGAISVYLPAGKYTLIAIDGTSNLMSTYTLNIASLIPSFNLITATQPIPAFTIPQPDGITSLSTMSDDQRASSNTRRNVRNGQAVTEKVISPPASTSEGVFNMTVEELEAMDLTIPYPKKITLVSSTTPTKLYSWYEMDDGTSYVPEEKIVKIRISNYNDYTKLPLIVVRFKRKDNEKYTLFTMKYSEMTVKGVDVEIICYTKDSNLKIEYLLKDPY